MKLIGVSKNTPDPTRNTKYVEYIRAFIYEIRGSFKKSALKKEQVHFIDKKFMFIYTTAKSFII